MYGSTAPHGAPDEHDDDVEKTMIEVLSALVAKLAAAGAAAKATAGVTVAAAAVAGAGATGVLPLTPSAERGERPAGVEQVQAPDEQQQDGAVSTSQVEDETRTPSSASEQEPTTEGSPAPQAGFGQGVAADARDGGVDGAQVAEQARTAERPVAPAQRPAAPARPEQASQPTGTTGTTSSADTGTSARDERSSEAGKQGQERAGKRGGNAEQAPAEDESAESTDAP